MAQGDYVCCGVYLCAVAVCPHQFAHGLIHVRPHSETQGKGVQPYGCKGADFYAMFMYSRRA